MDAGEGYLDPLRQTPFTGLKYLNQIDDGTWEYMLSPGSQGPGLMVWSMSKSCSSCGEYVPQWLLPVLCHWTSVTDGVTHLVDQTVADPFSDLTRVGDYRFGKVEMVNAPWGPMVGITEIEVPEQFECYHYSYTVSNNIAVSEDDCDGMACEGEETAFGNMLGLVPVMHVMPISGEQYARWSRQLSRAWGKYDEVFGNYGHCSCDAEYWLDSTENEDDDANCRVRQLYAEHGNTHVWNDEELRTSLWQVESDCQCPYHSFVNDWDAQVSAMPSFVDECDDDLGEAWDYLLDRYFTGWNWLEQHTPTAQTQTTERNAWLIFFSRRFSPFWGPTGLRDYLRIHAIEQYAA